MQCVCEKKTDEKCVWTDVQYIEYVDPCEAIRRSARGTKKSRSHYHFWKVNYKPLKNNKGLKSIKRMQLLGRQQHR